MHSHNSCWLSFHIHYKGGWLTLLFLNFCEESFLKPSTSWTNITNRPTSGSLIPKWFFPENLTIQVSDLFLWHKDSRAYRFLSSYRAAGTKRVKIMQIHRKLPLLSLLSFLVRYCIVLGTKPSKIVTALSSFYINAFSSSLETLENNWRHSL